MGMVGESILIKKTSSNVFYDNCQVCGKENPEGRRKYCSPECGSIGQELARKKFKQKKEAMTEQKKRCSNPHCYQKLHNNLLYCSELCENRHKKQLVGERIAGIKTLVKSMEPVQRYLCTKVL